MINWDDLRFFAELARRGSLSETARRLGTDHSTVARRIAALEQALDLRLFDRLPRGYGLTAEGEQLLERAGAVEEAIFAVQRLAGSNGAVAGRVRISAPPAFASLWLTPRLAPLRQRHSDLVIDIAGATEAASLVRREADLALRLSRPTDGSLVTRKLGDLHFGLYGARAYLAATREEAHVFLSYNEELDDVPQQRWLARVASGRPFVLLTNDLVSIIAGVRAGIGLAAIPHAFIENDPDLVCIAEGPEATRELWLVLHHDLRRAHRVRVVMDHLVAITATLR